MSQKCPLCTIPYKEINIDPNGGIYPLIASFCEKHRKQWEKWEGSCGEPCYIWDEGLTYFACIKTCKNPIKDFFKAQAEREGESK